MKELWNGVLLYGFLAISACLDGKEGRIPTGIGAAVTGVGLILACVDGWQWGIWFCLRFLVFAFPFFLLYLAGMTGGGDWKLFGITGALGGWSYGWYITVWGLVLAALYSLYKMLSGKILSRRLRLFVWYCRRCILSRTLYRYPVPKDASGEIHLGVFLFAGAVFAGVWIFCQSFI